MIDACTDERNMVLSLLVFQDLDEARRKCYGGVSLPICLRRELLSRRDTCKAARIFQPRVWCLILLLAMENSVRRWRGSVIFTRLRSALL